MDVSRALAHTDIHIISIINIDNIRKVQMKLSIYRNLKYQVKLIE